MVKSIFTVAAAALCFVVGAIAEKYYVSKDFGEFNEEVIRLERKLNDETATEEDVYALQNSWLEKKSNLHAFIPHTEIKELDLWIAESIVYAEKEDYDECRAKITVVKELVEQIPKAFEFRPENIF